MRITNGVPQGSVLGPILFICYVNDTFTMPFEGGGLLYADNTVLYCVGDDTDSLEVKMNNNLLVLTKWCELNRLTINSSKTKFLLFDKSRSHRLNADIVLRIGDNVLTRESSYLYLGIKLDSALSFKQHIEYRLKCCNNRVFTQAKIRKYLTPDLAVLLYKAFIMSRLNYGNIFCIAAAKKHADRMQKL